MGDLWDAVGRRDGGVWVEGFWDIRSISRPFITGSDITQSIRASINQAVVQVCSANPAGSFDLLRSTESKNQLVRKGLCMNDRRPVCFTSGGFIRCGYNLCYLRLFKHRCETRC